MSEERYSYVHNRVLIDSERVLSAQFDDAVIYVTGAQLELLRNVTQYLNRHTTYAAETHPGYYLTPDAADFDDLLEIVADLEETLMGNLNTIWGYKERLFQDPIGTSTGGAYTDAETAAVPSESVIVCEAWAIMQDGGIPCEVAVYLRTGSDYFMLYTAPSLASGIYVSQPANLTLAEGDKLHLRVYGLPDTEACYLWLWGHTMVVPA